MGFQSGRGHPGAKGDSARLDRIHPPLFAALLNEQIPVEVVDEGRRPLKLYRYGVNSPVLRLARALALRDAKQLARDRALGEAACALNAGRLVIERGRV